MFSIYENISVNKHIFKYIQKCKVTSKIKNLEML